MDAITEENMNKVRDFFHEVFTNLLRYNSLKSNKNTKRLNLIM